MRVKFRLRQLPRLIFVAIGVGIVTFFFAPPLILASILSSSDKAGYLIARAWAWSVAKIVGVSASLHGRRDIDPEASYVITPNHQGNVDILALVLTLPMKFRWVIKRELLRIPFFGWGLGRTGAISLDRKKGREAVKQLREGSSKLEGGWSLLIYPEGTRSPDQNMLPFKKGPFRLAVDTKVPILPVTVNGAFKILPRKTLLPLPGHLTVTVGDPIPTDNIDVKDIPQLMEQTRSAILQHLDPGYDPFDHDSRR
jgi:1-acyl-sn-glycerol-3-phosphate acyltransferase